MQCRESCGACCIAPSITGAFYGMPDGKPAGVACLHLDAQSRCGLFGDPRRPDLCEAFAAEPAVCGDDREQAMTLIAALEIASAPAAPMPLSGSGS
jgi:hypothetical protein